MEMILATKSSTPIIGQLATVMGWIMDGIYRLLNVFGIQNIGLWGIPTLIGAVLDGFCVVGTTDSGAKLYDYTLPMCIFTGIAILSLIVAFMLKAADRKYGYKLEEANNRK